MENNIPKNWDEITVAQFQELSSISQEEYSSISTYNLDILSIITDSDPEDDYWQDMDIDDLIEVYQSTKWLMSEPSTKYNNTIESLELLDLNNLSLGEFIDIQHYFAIDYVKNLHIICAILYKKSYINKWSEKILEPYEYDIIKRSENYLDIPITYVYGVIKYFLDWKDIFTNGFANMFEPDFSDMTEEEMFEGLDEDEIEELKKDLEVGSTINRWNWERIIYQLCNNDVTKFPETLNMNVVLIFNILSMKKELKL